MSDRVREEIRKETVWIERRACEGRNRTGRGLAKAVTSRLAAEVFARGKVPFYCAAWSNIPSVRNALACGFYPAWVQLTAKPAEGLPPKKV